MKAVGVKPLRGDFGLDNAHIITAGDPLASTLYFRMVKFGRDRMPHLGAELPDEAGLKLIGEWITSLSSDARAVEPKPSLTNASAALFAAQRLMQGRYTPAERTELLADAAKLPPGPVRELFEGYLPADERGGRKLGSNPRPKAILALKGDATRGERLFWTVGINCGKCHKVGDRGTPVGPDLTTIGKQRSAEDLLQSLLTPSRRVEPKFATYVVETTDGRVIAGTLVKRDEKAVVLREIEGREVVIAVSDVEQLRPSFNSLMPDGQMAGVTAQDAADLLEYLVSRK
jgi:putative heme-binding domain-containing protein